jgi:uncharacterized protein
VTDPGRQEFYVWELFQQLLRRNFAIGLEEYAVVMEALRAGFGWSSRSDLRQLLCAVWATSRDEQAVVSALFDQYVVRDWDAGTAVPGAAPTTEAPMETGTASPPIETQEVRKDTSTETTVEAAPSAPSVAAATRLPPLRQEELPRLPYSHVFLPQYPVSARQVAQTWRRLRWPLREGPATELDVDATVARRSRAGIAVAPVLRPRRRNRARLLLLVDRKGSMAPFHGYTDDVCRAIAQSGRLGRVGVFYFHDTPLEGTDVSLLASLDGQLFPSLDPLLADVPPLIDGMLLTDGDLFEPVSASDVFDEWADGAAIVIISDGGAARGRLDPLRLLDTIGSLKGLQTFSTRLVWLNPLPAARWGRSTATQTARHVPMFTMDRDGMHRAVNVLRGQPFVVDRPLPRSRAGSDGTSLAGGRGA